MKSKFGVVADDMSGGVAVGGEFSARGFTTLFTAANASCAWAHEVVVLDTASRYMAPAAAASAAHTAVQRLRSAGVTLYCKKVDSLFRGHPGTEIRAALDALNASLCLIAPASPRYGRITVNGHQLILGEQPVYLDACRLLEGQTGEQVGLLPLDTVLEGPAAVRRKLNDLAGHYRLIVADAVDQSQLNGVVQIGIKSGVQLFAGTYGLGEALVGPSPRPARMTDSSGLGQRPVVVVAGSYNAVTRDQVHQAEVAGAVVIPLDCTGVVLGETWTDEAQEAGQALASVLESGRDAILFTAADVHAVERLRTVAAATGLGESALASRIGIMLSDVLDSALRDHPVSGLVLTGGETARSLYDIWGAAALELGPELIPGSPLCRLLGGSRSGLAFVTKAGAYGDPDALVSLGRDLKRVPFPTHRSE